jgi:hypothetical protein
VCGQSARQHLDRELRAQLGRDPFVVTAPRAMREVSLNACGDVEIERAQRHRVEHQLRDMRVRRHD